MKFQQSEDLPRLPRRFKDGRKKQNWRVKGERMWQRERRVEQERKQERSSCLRGACLKVTEKLVRGWPLMGLRVLWVYIHFCH